MRTKLPRFLNVAFLGAALMVPMTMSVSLRADDHDQRRYHDKRNKDDHECNERENRAYRIWLQQNHRKYEDFDRIRERDRQSYWGWRHSHSDTVLRIDIR